jgi:3-phosphoshikimate 1-carboxyvinyltransferase
LDSLDVRSSIEAVKAMGAHVKLNPDGQGGLTGYITGTTGIPGVDRDSEGATGDATGGSGKNHLEIDCGNSGTTARLLMGILASYDTISILSGDESLSMRPMGRVIRPLMKMGAIINRADGQCRACQGKPADALPLVVRGTSGLKGICYETPMASAQVKTAILLAGLRACGETCVSEPYKSRDHTERMLPAYGVPVCVSDLSVTVRGGARLKACDVAVPGDPSSAAFALVAAALTPGSDITAKGVSLNPTRIGFINVMSRMGCDVSVRENNMFGSEPIGDVRVAFQSGIKAATVAASEVPSLIDEVPCLALLAACASGISVFQGVGELRVKESNRFDAIIGGLGALGFRAWGDGDDIYVEGKGAMQDGMGRSGHGDGSRGTADAIAGHGDGSRGTADAMAHIDAKSDHRLAMTWIIAARSLGIDLDITGSESIAISYPGFTDDLEGLSER